MDDRTKKEFIQLFNQGFEEIFLPHLKKIQESLKRILNKLQVHDAKIKSIKPLSV